MPKTTVKNTIRHCAECKKRTSHTLNGGDMICNRCENVIVKKVKPVESNFLDSLDTLEPSTNLLINESGTDDKIRNVTMQFRVTAREAEIIDAAVKADGCANRSHLCRSAMNDKLAAMGMFK